jgi:hypothetical protein
MALLDSQRPGGHWCGELLADTTLESIMFFCSSGWIHRRTDTGGLGTGHGLTRLSHCPSSHWVSLKYRMQVCRDLESRLSRFSPRPIEAEQEREFGYAAAVPDIRGSQVH